MIENQDGRLDQIRYLIYRDQLEEAIDRLRTLNGDQYYESEVLMIAARFELLQKLMLTGSISLQDYQLEKVRIVQILLSMLERLEPPKRPYIPHILLKRPPESQSQRLGFLSLITYFFRYIFVKMPVDLFGYGKQAAIESYSAIYLFFIKGRLKNIANSIDRIRQIDRTYFDDIVAIRASLGLPKIEIVIERDFSLFSQKDLETLVSQLKERLHLKGPLNIISVSPGSVRISLELSKEDAEKLFLSTNFGELKTLSVSNAKVVDVRLKGDTELDKIKIEIKEELAKNLEKGMDDLEKVVVKGSKAHDNFLLIKGHFSQIRRDHLYGGVTLADYYAYVSRTIQACFDLVNGLTGIADS